MNILIADDHAIVRKGLIELIREAYPSANITEVVNSHEVLDQVAKQTWSIILMDISMPGRNGVETLKQIRSNGVKTPILMLSAHPEDQYALRVLKAGASGFLNKDIATDELLAAISKILSGKKYISAAVAEMLAEFQTDTSHKSAHELLSDREMQMLQLIGSGKTVSEIAEQISLSVNTISTYRTRLLEKLCLKNNAELIKYAIDHGLV
ncbi:DNA-binding response regulator [Chryseotalea sanaruensis]|uniref:DNA-binding response regulator n=1 Tax=Chryseotalea sanaruensis TaxID=2482724 RepID=A0A401U6G5_9BACT|nr:response regulator transcription factor [Chryseotalea sanaruensis]GCC50475.1 DNA-binding response regulator [Chryseotalea sanaruensis]